MRRSPAGSAPRGAWVLVTDRDGELAGRVAETIEGAASAAVTSPTMPRAAAAVAQAVERFGRLDVLVNNAAFVRVRCAPVRGRARRHLEARPRRHPHRGLPLLSCRLRCASGRGAIVYIGSVNGEQDFGNHADTVAKAGLASLTRTLAGSVARRGLRAVNMVVPGTIRTPNWDGRDDEVDALARIYPLGRVGEPDDRGSGRLPRVQRRGLDHRSHAARRWRPARRQHGIPPDPRRRHGGQRLTSSVVRSPLWPTTSSSPPHPHDPR